MVNVNGQQVMCLCLCFIPALCVYTWKIILGVGPLFAGPGLLPLQEDPSRQDGKVSLFCHRHNHFLKIIVTRIQRIGLHPQLMSFDCESEGIEFTPMSRGSEKLTCQHALDFFKHRNTALYSCDCSLRGGGCNMHEWPVDKQGWKDVGEVAAKYQELFLAKKKDERGGLKFI